MKNNQTTIRLSDETKRLLELLVEKTKRKSANNVIEWLIENEAKRQKLK